MTQPKRRTAGNGFLMRQGFSILFSGWDTTAAPGGNRFTMKAPVAVNPDGSPIIGPAMEEFASTIIRRRAGSLTYPAATLDKSKANVDNAGALRRSADRGRTDRRDYANEAGKAIKLSGHQTPFQQGALYEFVYQAKNPVIAGSGISRQSAIIASFARTAQKDDDGNANPLNGEATAIYSACVSQPCRAMHDFILLGFNEDESGRKAIDGVVNWIGGANGIYMNYRFAQPFRTHRQHISRWFPEFQAPFTNQVRSDSVADKTERKAGTLLGECACPKIFEVNSANEYWAKNMAVAAVDDAGRDLRDEPANVRSYFMASLPHQAGVGATGRGICQQNRNPFVANAVLRALLVAIDKWVSTGTEPPQAGFRAWPTVRSCRPYLRRSRDAIPGVKYNGRMHTGDLLDYGPQSAEGILTILPPRLVGTPYPALVPRADRMATI